MLGIETGDSLYKSDVNRIDFKIINETAFTLELKLCVNSYITYSAYCSPYMTHSAAATSASQLAAMSSPPRTYPSIFTFSPSQETISVFCACSGTNRTLNGFDGRGNPQVSEVSSLKSLFSSLDETLLSIADGGRIQKSRSSLQGQQTSSSLQACFPGICAD